MPLCFQGLGRREACSSGVPNAQRVSGSRGVGGLGHLSASWPACDV